MDQKEQSRIQVPDIDQKVARKVRLRKIRKPYDLVLKAVPNINSLVFHWSSFPRSTSERGTAGLPCKASVLLYTGWYTSTQLTGSICIPNMVSANWKYLQPQYGLIPGSSLPSLLWDGFNPWKHGYFSTKQCFYNDQEIIFPPFTCSWKMTG